MDDKNKENELIDASSSPLFQLANETKEEEEQINNDFIAKKQNETNITNSEVNQMFNKGTVASDAVNNGTAVTTNPFESVTPQEPMVPQEPVAPVPEEIVPQATEQNTVNVSSGATPTQPDPNQNNPVPGFALLFILIVLVVGGFGLNFVFKQIDNYNSKQKTELRENNNNSSDKKEEEAPKQEEPKQEEPKQEETKKEEPAEEVTTTMVCKGATHDYGITINITATIVFKNNELYTIEVYEKSNSLNKDIIDLVAKAAYVGGYSYSTTSDYKSITMKGTKNTLSKSVKDEIGTKDKAESYYKKLGLSCNT